jgi:eukaryotic-like serine/threonine-protein kinase
MAADLPEPAKRLRPGTLSALLEELAGPEASSGTAWESALAPGAVVGRFELVRELGRGGFGIVYEARDTVLGRSVAFKAVKAGARPAANDERLLREAEASARLAHPNIVTLYDVGRDERGPYLVLELLRGRALAARLEQGPVAVREALRIAVEISAGLAHAHAHGVIHRDLTPGNVFLCDDGQVKLLDLGMAHAFGRRKLDGGTPAYMAPEQWRGAPEDERTDVFALGVLLHRMLAGELPFPDDGGRSIASSRTAPALDVPELPALGELVLRMLAKDPVDRPRDAGEVHAALAAYQQELSRAPASSGAGRVRARRRPLLRLAGLVAAGVLLGAAVAALVVRGRAPPAGPPSVAVMPFADLSPERNQAYFSEGLSDEIQNALTHVEGLQVTGRSSAFALKDSADDLRTLARRLNVRAVLEGSVRKAGSRVRVTALLVDALSGYHLWSESFDRDLSDVFAVQDEIARAVVAALQVKLLPGNAAPARARRTANAAAYNQYLLGRQLYARFTPDDGRRAVDAFEKAIALDPTYAPAWSALAIQLSNSAGEHHTREEQMAMMRRGIAAAEKAIALAPDLAEGYAARGLLRANLSWDWRGAQEDLDRAVALAPGDADTLRRQAVLFATLGRFGDALATIRRALDVDPLNPANWSNLGGFELARRDLPAARAAIERAREISPDMSDLRALVPVLLLAEGRLDEALAEAQRSVEPVRLVFTAIVERRRGRAADAQRAVDALVARHGATIPLAVAGAYAGCGDLDRAFAWLDRAYAQHDLAMGHLHEIEMFLPALAEDPRFRELLRKVGLPPPER